MTETVVEKNEGKPSNGRNRLLIFFTLILLIIALVWFVIWLFYFRFHEWTDDAYANGNMINVNTAISGSVIAFYADDTDLVKEGQLLVQLDPTKYQIAYDESLAQLASSVLNVRTIYDKVAVDQAALEAKLATLMTANYDFENRSRLVTSRAISNEDYTHSKDTFSTARFEYEQAVAQHQVSVDAAGNSPLWEHPLLEKAKANVREAYYNLQHCAVYAPATGYIAQRFVDVGEWVYPSTAMMAVIPLDYVWVDANYKETQLTKMRIGQSAIVTFDIYGSKVKYKGKVLGIAFGSGGVFSLIPPQNATGNWIKIVQRLPVRISLDRDTLNHFPVRLGISAYVDVDLTEQDLPMIARAPSTGPVCTTSVFDIDMEKVEREIEKIVHENLQR